MSESLNIRIHLEDGKMWATVDEYPGVFATGDTLDELRESLREGIALYLATLGEPVPNIELGPLTPDPVETPARAALQHA